MPAAMSATEMPTFDGVSGGARDRNETSLALHEQVVGFLVAIRTRRAVAGDLADDQPRIRLTQRCGSEAETAHRTRRKVVDVDIGARHQAPKHVERLGPLEIERERLLRPVRPDEVTGQPLHGVVVGARKIADAWPLDLDHARTEVGQLPTGKGRRNGLLDGDDNETVEWKR